MPPQYGVGRGHVGNGHLAAELRARHRVGGPSSSGEIWGVTEFEVTLGPPFRKVRFGLRQAVGFVRGGDRSGHLALGRSASPDQDPGPLVLPARGGRAHRPDRAGGRAGVVRGARAPTDSSSRTATTTARARPSSTASACPSLRPGGPPRLRRAWPVQPFDFGDESARRGRRPRGGRDLSRTRPRSTCPPTVRLRSRTARFAGSQAGPLAFVPDHLMDDPERTKAGLREAYRRLAELEFEHLLLAHGAPFVGAGRRHSPPSRRDSPRSVQSARSSIVSTSRR